MSVHWMAEAQRRRQREDEDFARRAALDLPANRSDHRSADRAPATRLWSSSSRQET